MIKSIALGIIALPAVLFTFIGARLLTVIFIKQLVSLTGPAAVLIVLTIALFIFFAFFLTGFLIWFHEQTNAVRRSPAGKVTQFSMVMAGGIFAVTLASSLGEMLFLAEKFNRNLFWLLSAVFIFLLFLSAYRYGKTKQRLGRNRANWWRG